MSCIDWFMKSLTQDGKMNFFRPVCDVPVKFSARNQEGRKRCQPSFIPTQGWLSIPRSVSVGSRIFFAVKTIMILILLLASLQDVSGDPVNAQTAKAAVRGWLKADRSPLQTAVGQQVKKVETFPDARGAPLYYVIYLDPEGFVIVAADDFIEPIIGFASSGQFDPSTNNPLGALVNSDLPDRIARVKGIGAAKAQGSTLNARNKWARLNSIEQMAAGVDLGIVSISDVRVSPLTETLWNQATAAGNACYNYYTPPNAEGSVANYYCGCVATAMAQLMRFWQYPVHGVGTASFTIYVSGVAQSRNLRGGSGTGDAYAWSDMVLAPSSSSTLAQRQAIGALCHDAGVSVNMSYTVSGSAADTLRAKNAFVSTFGYANAVKGYNSGATIGSGLNDMVNPNLDSRCPVLLGITGSSGGHAVVCDGYGYNLSTLYHHLNLGWSGSYTAWYNLPTIEAGGYTFNSVYKCIYNIWTNGTGEIVSGRLTDKSGIPLAGAVVTAVRLGGATYTATSDVRGIYALAKIPSSAQYTLSVNKTGYLFTNQIVTTGQSTDYSSSSGNRWEINFTSSDPMPTVTLGLSGSPLTETGGVATVTATLSATSAFPVIVNMAFSGTATFSNDYIRSGTNISIAAGSLNGSLTLTALPDTLQEGNETIVIDIDTVVNGTVCGTQLVTAIILDNNCDLTIISDWGSSSPQTGSWTYAFGTVITNAITSPDTCGTTQYACTGWAMVGNEPADGLTPGFTMFLTNNATLTWIWQTQYLLRVSASNGTPNVTNEWIGMGSNVWITITPDPFYHFDSWSGETNGCFINSNTMDAVLSMPRTIRAYCSADLATNGTPIWWLNAHGLTSRDWNVEALDDQDGDGFATWKEWAADTDPTNAQSFLQIADIQSDGEWIRVDWRGGRLALQELQYRPNLTDTDTMWTVIYTNMPPTEITNSIWLNLVTDQGFFRAKVER
jgi:hypothetical protein